MKTSGWCQPFDTYSPGNGCTRTRFKGSALKLAWHAFQQDLNRSEVIPLQIVGLGDDTVTDVVGIDAVQALLLALQKAGADLTAAERRGVELRWLEGSDLGFPSIDRGGSPPAR